MINFSYQERKKMNYVCACSIYRVQGVLHPLEIVQTKCPVDDPFRMELHPLTTFDRSWCVLQNHEAGNEQ